jgi:sugar phosphate isomerase/epimerase
MLKKLRQHFSENKEEIMIKIASMVGSTDLKTRAVAAYQGDFAITFEKLEKLGYEGVELMLKDPLKVDGKYIQRQLSDHNLKMVALCTGHVFGEDGLGLVGSDLKVSLTAMERLKAIVDFGAEHFGDGIMVNIGRTRGPGDPNRLQDTKHKAYEAFQELADYAKHKDVRIIIEPISIHEHRYILTTQDGVSACKAVNRSNFGLMLDTYHMNIQDMDMLESFRDAKEFCWHIHISDQNRKWPGSGVIDFQKVISVIKDVGYEGFLCTEILPWPDPDTAARSSMETLKRYLGE